MLDKYGNAIVEGVIIQFDDDYFGHGMQREVKSTTDGILGFEVIPNVSTELCFVSDWIKEIEVVTDQTLIRTVGNHITLDGERYMS
jgi:hypothetical protein